jgi:excisionase family DNA binding protein
MQAQANYIITYLKNVSHYFIKMGKIMNPDPNNRYSLLSVAQAAEQLGLTSWYVYQKIYQRQIACHKIGGRVFIAQRDLDDYVARGLVAALGERKAKGAVK